MCVYGPRARNDNRRTGAATTVRGRDDTAWAAGGNGVMSRAGRPRAPGKPTFAAANVAADGDCTRVIIAATTRRTRATRQLQHFHHLERQWLLFLRRSGTRHCREAGRHGRGFRCTRRILGREKLRFLFDFVFTRFVRTITFRYGWTLTFGSRKRTLPRRLGGGVFTRVKYKLYFTRLFLFYIMYLIIYNSYYQSIQTVDAATLVVATMCIIMFQRMLITTDYAILINYLNYLNIHQENY